VSRTWADGNSRFKFQMDVFHAVYDLPKSWRACRTIKGPGFVVMAGIMLQPFLWTKTRSFVDDEDPMSA